MVAKARRRAFSRVIIICMCDLKSSLCKNAPLYAALLLTTTNMYYNTKIEQRLFNFVSLFFTFCEKLYS